MSLSIRGMQGFNILVFIPTLTSRLSLATHKLLMLMLIVYACVANVNQAKNAYCLKCF